MNQNTDNIHPVFDRLLSQSQKEQRLQQKGHALWLTGLSGSGKSTIAIALEKRLFQAGFFVQVLDGDNIRSGLCNNLGFSDEDRKENLRRIAEVSKLFVQSGIICINSFISPKKASREMIRSIIGPKAFSEIHISASLEVCESRDVKGLYAKARSGEIKNFIGLHTSYDAPENPAIRIDTGTESIQNSVEKLYRFLLPIIKTSS